MSRSRLPLWEWGIMVVLVLTAWGLRVSRPAEVPPGWRDDELINIHALTGEVLAGNPTLYFTGASGHEPLYHTLHAGLLALVGMNPLGGHLLSTICGTLTIPLSYKLARRLFGRPAALLSAALLAPSFWSLMYSRVAIRHIMVIPLALAAIHFLWTAASSPRTYCLPIAAGALLAAALYTYPVARLLPLLLLAFALYLLLVQQEWLRRWWRPLLTALGVAALLTAPLWIAVTQGRSEAAAQGIGADARIAELSGPLRALQAGNPQPLLENTQTTLGMFHATGDAEWLYNLSGRPVFGLLGAALFLAGIGLCLWRWRRPAYIFLLIWLTVGLIPALVTLPPASLSHAILTQPAAYILPALAPAEVYALSRQPKPGSGRRKTATLCLFAVLAAALLTTNLVRDLRDYFTTWPERGMVRFLYREDYRTTARFLDQRHEIVDVAVGSRLMGPWDRLALADDLHRDDLQVRVFNPERALLVPAGPAAVVLLPGFPELEQGLSQLLDGSPVQEEGRISLYDPLTGLPLPASGPEATFANGLELTGAAWASGSPAPGQEATLWLSWLVTRPLDLPPTPVVANPPPPGVYSGPRLAVFTHLFAADETFVAGDDGLWVDPTTLQPGDRFVQIHLFPLPTNAPPGPYRLEVGLYDPLTGERWRTTEGADRVEWRQPWTYDEAVSQLLARSQG